MSDTSSDLLSRLLDAAEALFAERGYAAVRLRDIAEQLGVKHAALYYHLPGGKEQLYVEAMKHSFSRHRAGMEAAIAEAGPGIQSRLEAVAAWLVAHPPVNLPRMELADFPALRADHAEALAALAFDALRSPLATAITEAQARGEVDVPDPGLAAITFVSLVETVHASTAPYMVAAKKDVIAQLIHMMLHGWLTR